MYWFWYSKKSKGAEVGFFIALKSLCEHIPLSSYGRLTSPRYTWLVILPTLERKLRRKQFSIVFSVASQRATLVDRTRGRERFKSHRENKKDTQWVSFLLFWVRRWDLNLTTSGLWARRATKLLYSAIYRFPKLFAFGIVVPMTGLEPVREFLPNGF